MTQAGTTGGPTRFRDLAVGETFDFIEDDARYNSFNRVCRKISARRYEWVHAGEVLKSRVGSIDVSVYHVGRAYEDA